jgi:hypothetical protein
MTTPTLALAAKLLATLGDASEAAALKLADHHASHDTTTEPAFKGWAGN